MRNNPVLFNDPTGHMVCNDEGDCGGYNYSPASNLPNDLIKKDASGKKKNKSKDTAPLCDLAPKLCQGGRWNPLTYDTVGIQFEFDAKLGGGIEIKPYILVDGESIRNLDFFHMKGAFGISSQVTAGASVEIDGGFNIVGSDGKVENQAGIQNPSGNLGVCYYACARGSKSVSSVSYGTGYGFGGDLSYGMAVNSTVVYIDDKKNQGWWKIPFFPKQFSLPTWTN